MKKIIAVLMLVSGITGTLCAQSKLKEDDIFDIPRNSTNKKFYIDLGKGNKMQIELSDLKDLDRFKNMDSVLYGLLQDMKLLKDSIGDETYTRRIDYVMNDMEKRKIRVLRTLPQGSNFVVTDNDVSALKTEQDTVNFIGKVVYEANVTLRPKFTATRYYKVSFFVNDLTDLAGYMNGTLNTKIQNLQRDADTKWDSKGDASVYRLKKDESISANSPRGYVAGGDFIALRVSADIQNYKNYFVPSFTLGFNFILSSKNFKREIGLSTESHFSFARNSEGKLKTFEDRFITLSFAHGPIEDNNPRKESYQLFNLTFSYLVKNKGNIYDNGTMRLGVGALSLFGGKTRIQPVMHFTNLFKAVTPGIRLVQSF